MSTHKGKMVNPKRTDPVDQHLGQRIRMQRLLLHYSQEDLANHLGITFQQVQKYEKGVNRIGGGRMQEIANFLKCEVGWFYEGAPGGSLTKTDKTNSPIPTVNRFLTSLDGLRIAQCFTLIHDKNIRRLITNLIEALSMPPGQRGKLTDVHTTTKED